MERKQKLKFAKGQQTDPWTLWSYLIHMTEPGPVAASDPHADCRGFDPWVWQHPFVEMGHEISSTAILSLPLIQVGQLSATGESTYVLSTGSLLRKPAREQCD